MKTRRDALGRARLGWNGAGAARAHFTSRHHKLMRPLPIHGAHTGTAAAAAAEAVDGVVGVGTKNDDPGDTHNRDRVCVSNVLLQRLRIRTWCWVSGCVAWVYGDSCCEGSLRFFSRVCTFSGGWVVERSFYAPEEREKA